MDKGIFLEEDPRIAELSRTLEKGTEEVMEIQDKLSPSAGISAFTTMDKLNDSLRKSRIDPCSLILDSEFGKFIK